MSSTTNKDGLARYDSCDDATMKLMLVATTLDSARSGASTNEKERGYEDDAYIWYSIRERK